MLYTDQERAIMAEAIQPNMRSANIPQSTFLSIIADYLPDFPFAGSRVLDIGPGQLDFLDIARDRGSVQTVGVDFDPAIQRLGAVRGHDIRLANLRHGWPCPSDRFDLIFCRGSINCYWYPSESKLQNFLIGLTASMAPRGRLWIAPWNKGDPSSAALSQTMQRTVTSWARSNGIRIELPEQSAYARYGIGYRIPEVAVWAR